MRCSSPAGWRCRSRSPSSPRCLRSAARSRASASAACPRRPRRRRACRAGASRDRDGSAGAASGLTRQRHARRLRTARGVVRSLRIYYGDRARAAAMDRLYGRFVQRGDLVFDIGAHVGDRIAAFRRLGARVVAVEPQPALVRVLKLLYGRRSDVTIEAVAVGRSAGTIELMINVDNPTVSTASRAFHQRRARCAPAGRASAGRRSIRVPVTTLDALIARHGMPAFIKIDVEGFEAEALGRPDAAGHGAVVRIHHHPARGRARLRRALRGARLCALQCRARRESDVGAWRLDRRRGRSRAGSPSCRTRPIPETSMPLSADSARATAALSRRSVLLIVALIAAGFGLTLLCLLSRRHDLRCPLRLSATSPKASWATGNRR